MKEQHILSWDEIQDLSERNREIEVITHAICGKKNLVEIAEAILDLGYRRLTREK